MKTFSWKLAIATIAAIAAVVGAAATAPSATAHPRGAWATPASIKRLLVGKPFTVIVCGGYCYVQNNRPFGDYLPLKVGVISATVRGVGPSRVFGGVRRYRDFNVRACALDYTQGGERVGIYMIWHTRYPPVRTATSEDPGVAFGEDVEYRGFTPVARRC